MIEIKNFKMFDDQKALAANKFSRLVAIDTVVAVTSVDYCDDYGNFRVKVFFEHAPNGGGLFDTYEKSDAFFNALAALLPDSNDKKQTIDIKDFE